MCNLKALTYNTARKTVRSTCAAPSKTEVSNLYSPKKETPVIPPIGMALDLTARWTSRLTETLVGAYPRVCTERHVPRNRLILEPKRSMDVKARWKR